MTRRVEQLQDIQCQAKQLFEKKNKDYGDAFATYGTVGVLVRIGDKINRLVNITANGITLVNNEGLRDTLIDLHNYAAMAIMLLDEEKETPVLISPPPSRPSLRPEHPRVKALRIEATENINIMDMVSNPVTIFSPRRDTPHS